MMGLPRELHCFIWYVCLGFEFLDVLAGPVIAEQQLHVGCTGAAHSPMLNTMPATVTEVCRCHFVHTLMNSLCHGVCLLMFPGGYLPSATLTSGNPGP